MARPANNHPTDGELEILRILWDHDGAGLGQIRTSLTRDVANTTVATMLKVMLEKGLVRRSGGPRNYVWHPAVSQHDATSGLVRKLLDRLFDGSAGRLVTHLVQQGRLSQRERDELQQLLSEESGSVDQCADVPDSPTAGESSPHSSRKRKK